MDFDVSGTQNLVQVVYGSVNSLRKKIALLHTIVLLYSKSMRPIEYILKRQTTFRKTNLALALRYLTTYLITTLGVALACGVGCRAVSLACGISMRNNELEML